jgi:hypothetical protein
MPAFTPLPRCGAPRPGAAPEALTAAVLTIPMLIVVLALVPVLLIGPFLSPAHQRFVLHLLDGLRHWSLIIGRLAAMADANDGASAQVVTRHPGSARIRR